MSDRERILQRLQKGARPAPLPGPWPVPRQFDDPAARFAAAVNAAHGECHRAANIAAAGSLLQQLCAELNPDKLVLTADTLLEPLPLDTIFAGREWTRLQPGQPAADLCAAADIGISGVVAAFAETGTVVLDSGPHASRLATLLPPVHIALVPQTAVLPDVISWVRKMPRPLPANLTFVSGPSKTADIEQTMAIGVHGPGRFIVILIEQ